MPLREYVCNKCGFKKEIVVNGNYPKVIVGCCNYCSGDLIYIIGATGFRRDMTIKG
jgi:predicted nucleic acid-binding Zn ribbon protein